MLKKGVVSAPFFYHLSAIDVVRLLSQGFRTKEIADTLFVSVGTVKKHSYNMGQKWQLHNRIAISRRATELSYV